MADRLALKRLTASDLTFFESQFRKLDVGNQKSINLNANIFIEGFYPGLPDLVATAAVGDRIPILLTLLGPGGAGPYDIARAITKREAYKNWRLNGEFVPDPDDQPGRFDNLAAGDLAVFDFFGEPGPQKASLLLVSNQSTADLQLFASLNGLLPAGPRGMIAVTRAGLAAAAAGMPSTHPVWALAADPDYEAALEDAALGGATGIEKLATKAVKAVSAATLAAAKASAEKNGRDGEALAWIHLSSLEAAGEVSATVWASQTNAFSSYDFSALENGALRRIDAKSTSGDFKNAIHMSFAELTVAAQCEHYDLWRLYKLSEDGARLRIARDIAPTAVAILGGISPPTGVTVDGVSIDPAILQWGDEISIVRPEEESD